MRIGLIFSALLHVAIFAAVFMNFATGEKLDDSQPPPLPVDFITAAEFSEMKAGKKNAKAEAPAPPKTEQPKPEEPKPEAAPKPVDIPKAVEKPAEKQAAAAPPPPPKPAPAPEPEQKPDPKPEPKPVVKETPKPEAKPKAEKKTEQKPKPKPKPEPKPQRNFNQDKIAELIKKPVNEMPANSKFDADRIAALLNKDPNAVRPARAPEKRESWRPPSSLQEQAVGLESATGTRMTLSEIDAFRAQISRCWSPPVGGLGGESIQVRLRIEINKDGSIPSQPRIINRDNSAYFQAAADSAIRAVLQCQPYTMPANKYDQWRDMILNFDPSQM